MQVFVTWERRVVVVGVVPALSPHRVLTQEIAASIQICVAPEPIVFHFQ